MKLRWLLAPLQGKKFRDDVLHEPTVDEQFEATATSGVRDDLVELVSNAFRAHFLQQAGMDLHGLPGGRIDLEASPNGEADCTQQSQGVFLESRLGISDRSNDLRLQVGPSPDMVQDLAGQGVLEEPIDAEVASLGVFLCIGESDALGVASVEIWAVAAKGGDLKLVSTFADQNDAEASPHLVSARKEGEDLVGPG